LGQRISGVGISRKKTNLDIYLLFTIQWINGKNVLDLFLKPKPDAQIVWHHIVIFLVSFAAICFCRNCAGVHAGNIALMEFGSIFFCINKYWPNNTTCRVWYWLMGFSNYAFLIQLAYEQTLPCASTSNWPPFLWAFTVVFGAVLVYLRQKPTVEAMRASRLWTVEDWLYPPYVKDKKIPAGAAGKKD